MKTQIKIIERNSGEKIYICQEKGFYRNREIFIFLSIPVLGWIIIALVYFIWTDMRDSFQERYEFFSIQDAKNS